MPEPISMEEMRRMSKDGAQFEFLPRKMQLEKIETLVDQLKRLADANESISQNESDKALKSLVDVVSKLKLEAPAVDLTPLAESLRFLAETMKPKDYCPAKYTFTVQRDNRGRIETVVAEPDNG